MPRPHDPGELSECEHGHEHICQHELTRRILSTQSIPLDGIPIKRRRTRRRKVVDVCSGSQSLAKYVLLLDAGAEILSIDIIDKRAALAELPAHLHHRVHFVQLNLDTDPLTMERLQQLVEVHLRCNITDLYALHFSPCCKSYSTADAGRSGYRLSDGRPNPDVRNRDGSHNPRRYRYAVMWDTIVATVLRTVSELVELHPDTLITIENPYGMFRLHPSVTEILHRPNSSFRLLEVDYCKAADPEFDGDRVFTQKRSDILTHGVRSAEHFDTLRHTSRLSFQVPR